MVSQFGFCRPPGACAGEAHGADHVRARLRRRRLEEPEGACDFGEGDETSDDGGGGNGADSGEGEAGGDEGGRVGDDAVHVPRLQRGDGGLRRGEEVVDGGDPLLELRRRRDAEVAELPGKLRRLVGGHGLVRRDDGSVLARDGARGRAAENAHSKEPTTLRSSGKIRGPLVLSRPYAAGARMTLRGRRTLKRGLSSHRTSNIEHRSNCLTLTPERFAVSNSCRRARLPLVSASQRADRNTSYAEPAPPPCVFPAPFTALRAIPAATAPAPP